MESHFETLNTKHKLYKCKEGGRPPTITDFNSPAITHTVRNLNDKKEVRVRDKVQKVDLLEVIEKNLYSEFVPPSVLVDESQEIVHIFKDVSKFLRLPSGKMVYNIMKMVHPDLSIALGTAIHKAMKDQEDIKYSNLVISLEDKKASINLYVKPVHHDESESKYALVVFDEQHEFDPEELKQENFDIDGKTEQRIKDLEQELQYTRENLQATIEELETSNEELQATNEELIASNEELQSTNEELQSVNEELYTVNSEYQNKIDELTELNNDINNWMATTYIGTIFLDLDLRIRKFTPGVTETINLIENDIGRPIKHISHKLAHENFLDDIEYVLETLEHFQKEVRNSEGQWFLMKIVPYRTLENAVKGVVVTFIDITDIKEYEEKIQRERDLLIRVMENSPIGKTMVDADGNITFANRRAEEILGLKRDKITKRKYNAPEWDIQDINGNPIPDKEKIFNVVMKRQKPVYDHQEVIKWPDGKKVVLSINGAPMIDEDGKSTGAVFSLELKSRLESGI
jgi:two-component system CheB/CheR fusion protein